MATSSIFSDGLDLTSGRVNQPGENLRALQPPFHHPAGLVDAVRLAFWDSRRAIAAGELSCRSDGLSV
jgi:hypothetical protein